MGQGFSGFFNKHSARKGQSDLAIGALEQLDTQSVFEVADLFAQGGLRDMNAQCCAAEVQLFRYGDNITKKPKFNAWVHGEFPAVVLVPS
jgi:hypothetical protein